LHSLRLLLQLKGQLSNLISVVANLLLLALNNLLLAVQTDFKSLDLLHKVVYLIRFSLTNFQLLLQLLLESFLSRYTNKLLRYFPAQRVVQHLRQILILYIRLVQPRTCHSQVLKIHQQLFLVLSVLLGHF
jgi:hypothetical protein